MPKFVYHDDNGRILHAGGLLLYDSSGLWLIKEYYKDNYKFIDPGGKYTYQDCDIINTICREFCEETYFILPVNPLHLKKLLETKNTELVYVCPDLNNNPTYACLLVNVDTLNMPDSFTKVEEKFLENRRKAMRHNPDVPTQYYASFELCYIPYSEINQKFHLFHFRLRQIIANSFLKVYIKY
jgi:hypothetical protein